jgi:hypothetical protein
VLSGVDGLHPAQIAAVEPGVRQALVLDGDAVKYLHHLAELDVADEAHVVELDRLPPGANVGGGQADPVDVQLVDVGVVGIGDHRILRFAVLSVVVIIVEPTDVDQLDGGRQGVPCAGFHPPACVT